MDCGSLLYSTLLEQKKLWLNCVMECDWTFGVLSAYFVYCSYAVFFPLLLSIFYFIGVGISVILCPHLQSSILIMSGNLTN